MIALSLWRPWPWCFFHAGKRIENRGWKPPEKVLGQWVAMHAAMRFDYGAVARMHRGDFGPAAQRCPARAVEPPDSQDHPTGIVGAMFVTGAFRVMDDGSWETVGYVSPPPGGLDYGWAFGPWSWVISGVVELAAPIPCKGKQGLFPIPDAAELALRSRIVEAA